MANFCTNCGSKLEDYYNYCIECGAKINKSDIKQHNSFSNQHPDSIGKEREKVRVTREKEMSNEEMAGNEIIHGGYCDLSCKHCYEEFLDSGGSLVGDFTDDGMVEYYCDLGHSVFYGSFCKDYE